MQPRHLALSLLLASAAAAATEGHHWGYEGEAGPEHWGELAPEFVTCASGKEQSPIDIQTPADQELPELAPRYAHARAEIVHNGHTVQVNIPLGGMLSYGGRDYRFKQFHFHTPSENRIKGESFPMEVHLVHADAEGHLAVLGALIKPGAGRAAQDAVFAKLPQTAGEPHALDIALSPADFLPAQLGDDYYRFAGSLTTPPCSEGVQWLLLKAPLTLKAEHIDAFKKLFEHGNARPPQAVNARKIEE